jgi:hypothetical protein
MKKNLILAVGILVLLFLFPNFIYNNSDSKTNFFFKNNLVSAQPVGIVPVGTGGSLLGIPRRKMVVDENNPERIWVFNQDHLTYYSSNAGLTWTGIDFFTVSSDHDSFDIDSSGNIHAAQRGSASLYKKINSPATQASDHVSANDESFSHFSGEATTAVLSNGNEVYVFTRNGNDYTIYYDRSTDGGITFSQSGIFTSSFLGTRIRIGATVINNLPYVFVYDREGISPGSRLTFFYWDGSGFVRDTDFDVTLATSIDGGIQRAFSVTVTSDQTVHIVYWDQVYGISQTLKHKYKKKTDISWTGPYDLGQVGSALPTITSHGNDVYVAYSINNAGSLYYKKFDGTTKTWGISNLITNSTVAEPAFPKKVPASSDFVPLAWTSGGSIYYYAIPTTSAPCVDADNDSYNSTSGGNCGSVADCNDGNSAIHPGATEICDGVDNNCVGGIDEGVCSADVNNDGSINIIDLALTTYWQGRSTNLGDNYNHLDINSDGVVNWLDVLRVILRI